MIKKEVDSSLGRILIVDDNPKNIQVAASVLAQNNFDIEFSLDAKSGMSWLEKGEIDLVLLDIMMPDVDGYEMCRDIKQRHELREIPIIFLTAKNDRESIIKGFDVGAEDFITKPFDGRELVSRVKVHLELKKSREQLNSINSELKFIVDERTIELSNANAQLSSLIGQLKDTNKELIKIDQSKHQFLTILGHEVGGALNEAIGMLQVLKHRIDSRKDAQIIDKIDNSMIKLETFVNAALRITALQSKGAALEPEKVDLSTVVGFCLLKLDEKSRLNKIRIRTTNLDKPNFVLGEQQLLSGGILGLLDYLISNASPETTINIVGEVAGVEEYNLVFLIKDAELVSVLLSKGAVGEIDDRNIEFNSIDLANRIMIAHGGGLILEHLGVGALRCILRFYHKS